MERNHAVDILKGVCIILVIINHSGWGGAEQESVLFSYVVNMAVPTFMFLSGYVGAMTSFNRYKQSIILKKVTRFTVPFIIVYVVEISILCYTKNWTLGEGFISILTGGIGPGSYYYPLTIQFIFVFPAIYRVVKNNQTFGLVVMGGGKSFI